MSLEDKIYQIVFLLNIENLRNDRTFKKNATLGSLKILTFYSSKAKTESKKLQWGFTFYNESSPSMPKSLPVCKFRDFDLKNFEEFESVLDNISKVGAEQKLKQQDHNKCSGCSDRSCDCWRNAPSAILSRAFTDVLSSFPWDNPDISSPVKPLPMKRLKGQSSESTINGHTRRSTRNLPVSVIKQPRSNLLFVLSKCPVSKTDLALYTPDRVITDSDYLLEELMPTGIRKNFHHAMKIALFWIDTHTQIKDEDISGLCVLSQALDQLGKLLTLPSLLGSSDLSFIPEASVDKDDVDAIGSSLDGGILPDSSSLGDYLLKPSVPCHYEAAVATNQVRLQDSAGSEVAMFELDVIVPHDSVTVVTSPAPRILTLLGTLSVCSVPLSHIEARPVYSVRESTATRYSVWSQMLTSLAKKNMVLVVDVQTDVDHLPTVSVIQALTQLTASLTLLKSEGVIDLRKKVAFRTTAPTLSQSETQELSQGLTPVQFEADGTGEEYAPRAPQERDQFQPSLLETWLLPSAIPSSLSVLSNIFCSGDLDNEDVRLLEKLQRAYMEKKSQRYTNRAASSSSKRSSPRKQQQSPRRSAASPTRRSPRKKGDQPPCRRSPRKAVRNMAKGSLSNQSLPELDRRSRSNTAPTRVDIIMQKSKQARHHSTEDIDKKPGRKSTETAIDIKKDDTSDVMVFSTEEELFGCLQGLHSGALCGQHTPGMAMIKVTLLIAAHAANNTGCCAEDLLKRSVRLMTIEVSKKHVNNSQAEKIREFECQLLLWMETITRGWITDKDMQDEATEQVVDMLRRLSFLQDPGIWTTQLSDLLVRYGDSEPSVLYEIYRELGQPIPYQLQGLFSPDDLDTTLDSQPPDSALSFVDSVHTHRAAGILSNKPRTRKVVRHTSFHVAPQRQIKVTVGNKNKGDKEHKRRSARIASTSKPKQVTKDVAVDETKRIRRNLFSGAGGGGGGVKLERRQSVAVMETDKGGKSAKSRVRQMSQNNKGHHRRGSLVSETPAHKQIPNQLWQRQERQRQRSRTVTADVTIIQESPDKRLLLEDKAKTAPKGVTNFVRRASFYSGAPDKVSRAVKKCMDSRMTKRLLSPRRDPLLPRSLSLMSPRRRIQPTTLFSKLLDPSPHKPVRHVHESPVGAVFSGYHQPVVTGSGGFSSPSKNTRSKMRLFQSPSPPGKAQYGSMPLAIDQGLCGGTPKKGQYGSPLRKPSPMVQFESPSRNTRLQSRLQSPHAGRPTPSSIQRLFQSPPPGNAIPRSDLRFQGTPTKIQRLFQSPPPGSSTPGKSTQCVFQSPLVKATPTKIQTLFQSPPPGSSLLVKATPTKIKKLFQSPPYEQSTPTKSLPATCPNATPTKTPRPLPDFSSPSKNTRSHSKIFQPPYADFVPTRAPRSDGPVRRLPTMVLPASLDTGSGFSTVLPASHDAGSGFSTVLPASHDAGSGFSTVLPASHDAGSGFSMVLPASHGTGSQFSLADDSAATIWPLVPKTASQDSSSAEMHSPVKGVPSVSGTPSKNTRSQSRHIRSPGEIFDPTTTQCSEAVHSVNISNSLSRVCPAVNMLSPGKADHRVPDNLNHWPRKKIVNTSPEVTSPLVRRVKMARASHHPSQDSLSSCTQEPWKSPSTPRGKRKLCLISSPEKQEGTPTKRYRSSGCSPYISPSTQSSVDYFNNDEVFIDDSTTTSRCPEILTATSYIKNKRFCAGTFSELQPLRNRSVEFLKNDSTGSSIASPVFPGLERLLLEDIPSSPGSPVFETTPGHHQNKENTQTTVSPVDPKTALSHFSPQLSRQSLTHLVTSPLLDLAEQKARRAAEMMASPEKPMDFTSPKNDANTDGSSSHTPRGSKKTFCRMPTKLAL